MPILYASRRCSFDSQIKFVVSWRIAQIDQNISIGFKNNQNKQLFRDIENDNFLHNFTVKARNELGDEIYQDIEENTSASVAVTPKIREGNKATTASLAQVALPLQNKMTVSHTLASLPDPASFPHLKDSQNAEIAIQNESTLSNTEKDLESLDQMANFLTSKEKQKDWFMPKPFYTLKARKRLTSSLSSAHQ